jgi:hypothetical protein
MISYPYPCPHCDHVADSMDSNADSKVELDWHMQRAHPDMPDWRIDPRWNPSQAGGNK